MRIPNPIAAFKDPVRRPRAVIWTGIALMTFTVLWAVGIDGTSTYWFCTTPCHVVHDDNTKAFDLSSHTNVACVACHEPVNASGLVMTFKKIEVLPDLPATILGNFELPANALNHVALEMPEAQCTQCHNLGNRLVTPRRGLKIDHAVHSKNDVQCTLCHNRVAHPEGDIAVEDLNGGRRHDDWLTMDACFRCHGLEKGSAAPGACSACHTAAFDLKPPSHDAKGWYTAFGESGGHAKAAREETAAVEKAHEINVEAGGGDYAEGEPEGSSEVEKSASEEAEEERAEFSLRPSSEVNSCYTCHKRSFCDNCHGYDIPHPASFRKRHPAAGYAKPESCAKCHARSATEAKDYGFCNACHHPASTPGTPWVRRHPAAVSKDGATPCFECHSELDCSGCHVRGLDAGRAGMRERFERE